MTSGKKILLIAVIVIVVLAVSVFSFFKGSYNKFVTLDEGVKSAWAQVENQLQRRYDLIPNLVETVKGYAKQEKDVLVEVTNARPRVGHFHEDVLLLLRVALDRLDEVRDQVVAP